MKPASPVIPGLALVETVYAKDQPPYEALPTYALGDDTGTVVSRWRLSWRERLSVLLSGDIYLWQMTFGKALQPVTLEATKPRWEGAK